MKIIVANSEKDFDIQAARIVADKIKAKPNAVLGFATGNTTIGFHRELSAITMSEKLDWSAVRSVNIDEFLTADKTNPMSVYYRMFDQLLNNTNILPENVFIPNSSAAEAEQTCIEFPKQIAEIGYVDLQVLGIGSNGHIAMNEPLTPWNQDMLITSISSKTIADKAELWGGIDKMPKKGISMGMRLIMQGRTQLLMAKGKEKAEAIQRSLYGEVSTNVPASVLQMHPDVIVLLDKGAASLL